MTEFAKNTKIIMSEKKINQKQLANLSGVSESSLCRYLKGDICPRMDIVINVANALGVSQNYLVGGDLNRNQKDVYVETRSIILRNRGQLSSEEKNEIIKLLFGDK